MSNLTTQTDGRTRRINLYDPIGRMPDGTGITPDDVVKAIGDVADVDQLNVHINSPGGVAFDGLAIYNVLVQFPGVVNTVVDGVAASAASIIFMAGQQRTISEGGMLMIHGALITTSGNQADHIKQVETLGRLNRSIAKVYAKTTQGDAGAILELMGEDTWMEADEALADGYATSVSPSPAVACAAAEFMNQYRNLPPQVSAWAGQGNTPSETPTMADDPTKPEDEETAKNAEHDPEEDKRREEEERRKEEEDEETVASLKSKLAKLVEGDDDEEETIDSLKAKLAKLVEGDEEEEETPTNAEHEEEDDTPDAQAIAKAFAHDESFACKMIAEGKTLNGAYQAYAGHAKTQVQALQTRAAAMADGSDAVAIAPAPVPDETPGDQAKVFKAAARMSNKFGRNAYLTDQGQNPEDFATWQKSH